MFCVVFNTKLTNLEWFLTSKPLPIDSLSILTSLEKDLKLKIQINIIKKNLFINVHHLIV